MGRSTQADRCAIVLLHVKTMVSRTAFQAVCPAWKAGLHYDRTAVGLGRRPDNKRRPRHAEHACDLTLPHLAKSSKPRPDHTLGFRAPSWTIMFERSRP